MSDKIWYKDWFNSPYYHVLYKSRDYNEAATFINNLIAHLQLSKSDNVWDLACGKGRHSIYLNSKGINVIGTDLSDNSISEALQSSNDKLEFFVHDMRTPFRINYFTHVFNLFTSIGYFENDHDNLKVFKSVHSALKPGGVFVIDFFNCKKVMECMLPQETKVIEGISFSILKTVQDNKIIKRIEFSDKGHDYFFEEKVSLLNKDDFMKLAQQCGFTLQAAFGDYSLNAFDQNNSERLILIFKK
jgi:SAM-dependent methyltransferase